MSKAEWGLKRICPSCGTRYYDMKKNPPICPSCGTQFDAESQMKSRRGRSAKVAAAPAPEPEEVIDDIEVADDEEADDALIEDAEELGDDPVEKVVVGEEER